MIRRVLLAAVLLAGTVAVAVPVGPAAAFPMCKADYYCTVTYYADVKHTVVNGFTTRFCDGSSESSGVLSGYVVVTQAECGPTD
jgi:Family of unknown function (DUF6289)